MHALHVIWHVLEIIAVLVVIVVIVVGGLACWLFSGDSSGGNPFQ